MRGELEMYIVAGLGNPGREYDGTRHNAGFMVIDRLAAGSGISLTEKKYRGLAGKGVIAGQKVLLVKPQTFMNLSGECLQAFTSFYKIDERRELIVICDDIHLEVGQLRIRKKGSAGGHNGLKNIIAHLGHEEFIRVRVGVGENTEGRDLVDHVLGRFTGEDLVREKEAFDRAADAVEMILTNGPDAAMNQFNHYSP